MVGEFKKAPKGFIHLLVPIDKFTKWIEACSITNLKFDRTVEFIGDIINKFRVPKCIITDY